MVSTVWSRQSPVLKAALRAAAEGAGLALLGLVLASFVWTSPAARVGLRVGVVAAWAATTASVAWLVWARGRSMKAFWWAFGGGLALRAAALGGLVVWAWRRDAPESVLVPYAFVVLILLLTLELRHLK